MRTPCSPRTSLLACLALLSGCAGLPNPFAKKAASEPIHQTVAIPTVAPQGKTVEMLKRGKVTISVATTPFVAKQVDKKSYKSLPTLITTNGRDSYEVTTTPVWCPYPSRLRFKIRVVNSYDDVIRLSGAVVRINIDGKDYALDAEPRPAQPTLVLKTLLEGKQLLPPPSGVKNFTDAVLAPEEQREFDLYTTPAAQLRDGANISLRIYGVPTGSGKEKGNYEWNYKVSVRSEARDSQVHFDTVALTPQEVETYRWYEDTYPPETRDERAPGLADHGDGSAPRME